MNNTATSPKLIFGLHPVLEALRCQGEALEEIWISNKLKGKWVAEIKALAQQHAIRLRLADPAHLSRLAGGGQHQGVVARTHGYRYLPFPDLLTRLQAAGSQALVVLADGLQDPMNLGNLLRTACLAGAQGVVIPKDRAVGLTPTVAKAAAGAVAHIPVSRVTNLAVCLEQLKKSGLWVVGADAGAPHLLFDLDLTGPLALVIGGEHRGLRPRVREACDLLAAIPMPNPGLGSFNAATAAAIFLYEIVRQRWPRSQAG